MFNFFFVRTEPMGFAQWGFGATGNNTGVLWLVRATTNDQQMYGLVLRNTGVSQDESSFCPHRNRPSFGNNCPCVSQGTPTSLNEDAPPPTRQNHRPDIRKTFTTLRPNPLEPLAWLARPGVPKALCGLIGPARGPQRWC